jgi:hypothetical protein
LSETADGQLDLNSPIQDCFPILKCFGKYVLAFQMQ